MRKHLYLITEHEKEERIGNMKFTGQKMSYPDKNEEGKITIRDDEIKDFRSVGMQVCVGYHDFESKDEFGDPDKVHSVMQKKLREIDQKWLDKAGVELENSL